jgi:hypothetical protein
MAEAGTDENPLPPVGGISSYLIITCIEFLLEDTKNCIYLPSMIHINNY